MDVKHHPPIIVPTIEDLWEDYWTSVQTMGYFTGHDTEPWHRLFRTIFFLVMQRTLMTVHEIADTCQRNHQTLDVFVQHVLLLRANADTAERQWNDLVRSEHAERSIKNPWWRALHNFFFCRDKP